MSIVRNALKEGLVEMTRPFLERALASKQVFAATPLIAKALSVVGAIVVVNITLKAGKWYIDKIVNDPDGLEDMSFEDQVFRGL